MNIHCEFNIFDNAGRRDQRRLPARAQRRHSSQADRQGTILSLRSLSSIFSIFLSLCCTSLSLAEYISLQLATSAGLRIRSDPVFLPGSGSGFHISLDQGFFNFSGSGSGYNTRILDLDPRHSVEFLKALKKTRELRLAPMQRGRGHQLSILYLLF